MTDNALDEKACAQTSLTDHIARFWHMIEDEPHVRILVNVRRDMSSVPYWDSSSFPNDVAKAIAAERRASPSQVSPQPQAGEPIGYLVQGFDGEPFFAPDREQYDRQGHAVVPVYASPQPANPAQVTDTQIEHMVQRFLGWRLPETFGPDAGIRFERVANAGTPYEYKHEPVGTNLFDHTEAKAMVLHMLEELPAAIGAGGQAVAVPTVNELFANCDRWGAVEWFNRLAMAIHNRDKAVVAGDDLSFATYDNIAKSSAARLVHDFEQEVRSALSQPLPADERVVEALALALELIERSSFQWTGAGPHPQVVVEKLRALSAKEDR